MIRLQLDEKNFFDTARGLLRAHDEIIIEIPAHKTEKVTVTFDLFQQHLWRRKNTKKNRFMLLKLAVTTLGSAKLWIVLTEANISGYEISTDRFGEVFEIKLSLPKTS
jgi:hypothetical protein